MFNRITILGVGLIGASFALAVRHAGLCNHIAGYGRRAENLAEAKKRGIIDSFGTDPVSACRDSDLIMLSTPVGSFLPLISAVAPSLAKGTIVTDAGSVKGTLVYDIERSLPEGIRYVGAHPIAGSDRSGIDSASPGLFRNAKCVITPTGRSDADAIAAVTSLWKALGSHVLTMTPEEHDRIYASVSHLPHLVAYALVNSVAEVDRTHLSYCGKGFLDMTRIASSSPELWTDICLLNRDNLTSMVAVLQKNLDTLNGYLKASDFSSLKQEFEKARTLREAIGQD